jgi:hypothetical protein
MKTRISFHTTREEAILIGKIIKRAVSMLSDPNAEDDIDRLSAHMDISACIANGCPLKLQEWLDAPDFDFSHDFYGIMRHIDRTTGELADCFLPRFYDSAREEHSD